ncbi:hypothetical protein [Saccharothrix hoggarensis]|uniref:Uncharacterized protein n=1 Tax=Saccharothrix hoggarensis TaxID=913853 RepID=A0ABW3R1X7_9PSEU
MHRESDKHGPLRDDELKHELEGTLRGNRPSRAEEWRDPESPTDDEQTAPPFDRPL